MSQPIPFPRHPLAAVMALACGALPAAAPAAVPARVDFATAGVEAVGSDGARRALAKGAEVRVGDAVETNAGRAWLRFSDGGYISLQPGSVFRVDDYNFSGAEDGSEKGFFSLLKGGLRTITGAIGHRNSAAYRVKTPVATIGIRGTEYLAVLGDSLTVSCGQGVCVVTNEAGEVVLQAGQTVYIEDEDSTGQLQTMKPVLPPAPPVEFRSTEDRDDSGDPVVVVPPELVEPEPPPEEPVQLLPDGAGYTLAATFAVDGDGAEGTFLEAPVTADFNQDSELESYTGSFGARGTAKFADTGADAIIGWGRWTEGTTEGDTFPHPLPLDQGNESFHYVIGKETPELPADVIGTYALIGATTPTFSDGAEGGGDFGDPVSVTGALAANFATGEVQTTIVLDFTGNDLEIDSGLMNIVPGTARFGGTGSWANGGPCSSCTTAIAGFFAGPNAERAGYAYDVYVTAGANHHVYGAAVFRQTGLVPFDPD